MRLTGSDVVGCSDADSAGAAVDADAGYEDGVDEECEEPVGIVCPDAKAGFWLLGISSWQCSAGILDVYSHTLHFSFPLLMVSAPPALNLAFFEWFQASFPHSWNAVQWAALTP